MSWITSIWDQWFLIAFLAPFFWAIVNIIDVYFVSNVYEDEWNAIFINSFFQVLPWLLPVFGLVSFHMPGYELAALAVLSGAFFALSFFFYFKTLFHSNDVVVAVALWNVSIPLVPFLAWLLIDEHLAIKHYLAIILTFVGALLLVGHRQIRGQSMRQVLKTMVGAVGLLSLSMVLQKEVYGLLGEDFWSGFLLFSLGSVGAGLALFCLDRRPHRERLAHIVRISRLYLGVFFIAELLNILAVMASQRAIDLSPAVSFVIVIESVSPVFVMLLSFLVLVWFRLSHHADTQSLYQQQLTAFKTKLVACCIIAVGIYLIS